MGTIKVELIPVEQLKPYERNARRHAEADVQREDPLYQT